MQPELQLVQQWLEKVRSDLRMAEMALKSDRRLRAAVGFQCQQAVDKCLKGFLTSRDVDFVWLHDIKYLLDLCISRDAGFERFGHSAKSLNDYAVTFGYPSSRPDPTPEQAREAFAVAREVYQFVLDRLPVQAHPGA